MITRDELISIIKRQVGINYDVARPELDGVEYAASVILARLSEGWRPIESAKDLPQSTRFLVWDSYCGVRLGLIHRRPDHDDWLSYLDAYGGSSKGGHRATHWRPLPSPPKESV